MPSLRTRIIAGIAIAVLVPLAIGITCIFNLRAVALADQTLFREGTSPLLVLSDIAVTFERMRIASRDMLAATNKSDENRFGAQLEAFSGQIDRLVEEYARSGPSPEENVAFHQFSTTRKKYLDYVARIIALARADRDSEGWLILNSDPYNAVVDAQLAAINKLEGLQIEQTKEIITNNGVLARRATLEVAAAMFLAMVFSVGGGLLLDRLAADKLRAQKSLADSEHRFQLVSRATNDGIWDWDLVTGKLWWNENLQTTFGYAPDELEPGVEGWENQIHPDDRQRVHASIGSAIENGAVAWADEYRFRRRDGTYADVLDRGYIIRDSANRPVRMVGAMMDITLRKRTEWELKQAREAAESASRAKSDFLANMSHEIRTPMNGIIGMTELALDTELTPEQREYLGMIKTSADSLLGIINDILDLSKIEAGKFELEMADFALRDLLEPPVKALGIRAHQKGLELNCHVPPELPPYIVGDSARLRQIVVNLVGNAIKFTEQGEVTLRVLQEPDEDGKSWLHFLVQDTGIGISPDQQTAIFEAFNQADSSITRRYGGTGLGLSISRRLVDAMGGRFWLESAPGQGSTFHFTIPLVPGQASGRKLASPAELANVAALIVDDNGTNRRILEEFLLSWRMRPTLAADAHAALAALQQASDSGRPFPLLLVDANMPEIDGFTLIARIRQNPLLSGATIMMLTSSRQVGDIERCRKLGVAAYLTKPIGQAELREALINVLGVRQCAISAPRPARPSSSNAPPPLHVLLAEDNLINQRLAVRLLEKHNCQVDIAANGREALEKLAAGSFDLVIMDVHMPEMDGLEATAIIRQRERSSGHHLPILALTASVMRSDQEHCLAAGMDGYISKPIRPADLYQKIDELSQVAK